MRSPRRSFAGIAAVAALTAGMVLNGGPASAAPPTKITEPIDFTFVDEDFCGAAGLTVEEAGKGELRGQIAQRRGETYFSAHRTLTVTFTNTATGAFFTLRDITRVNELRVTDNGDGTITVLSFGTGFSMMYGPDGRIIGKNTGQSRFETVIDDNGTPANVDDDTLISDELVLGSTGTNDDFCEVALSALT